MRPVWIRVTIQISPECYCWFAMWLDKLLWAFFFEGAAHLLTLPWVVGAQNFWRADCQPFFAFPIHSGNNFNFTGYLEHCLTFACYCVTMKGPWKAKSCVTIIKWAQWSQPGSRGKCPKQIARMAYLFALSRKLQVGSLMEKLTSKDPQSALFLGST